MNVVLRHPDTEPPSVSLHLRQAKVSEVLDQLATATGLELQVEGKAVLLVPKAK